MTHRDDLLAEMDARWRELRALVDALRAGDRLDTPLGDDWRARDVLAHIALWERVATRKLTGAPVPLAGDLVAMDPWDLDRFNETLRDRWRDQPVDAVLDELDAAHAALVTAVSAAADADCAPGGPAHTVIADDGAGHYPAHLDELRRAVPTAPARR